MHLDPLAPVLLALVLILAAAKIGSEIFERLGQPSVLGELIAGMIVGNLVLIWPDWTFFEPLRSPIPTESWAIVIDGLARLGVILLLFEVGLESTVSDLAKVGASSFVVALIGVVVPFALGFGVSLFFIHEIPGDLRRYLPGTFDLAIIHAFVGAILCATSVGITARVFKDLGTLQTKSAKIVLGAAVIDDVFGLVILAVVSAMVTASVSGSEVGIVSLVRIAVTAIGFLALAIVIGMKVVPRTMRVIAVLRTQGMMVVSSLLLCFSLSWLAGEAGLATIVGAFAAGLILEEVHFHNFNEHASLHDLIKPISTLFVPIFFVLMGIQVRLEEFVKPGIMGLALGLTAAAIIGKQACGFGVLERGVDRRSVGVGMIPRGEVGLIFAAIGKALNVVDGAIYSAVVFMVIFTTLVTPPALKWTIARWERKATT